MRSEVLFINGVFKGVLEDILAVQSELPDAILFLQPYSSSAMTRLRDDPPTTEAPMRVYLSTTTALSTVRYEGEIVGWDDKRKLSPGKRRVLSRLIYCLQPTEGGVYDASRSPDGQSVNLLHIRRLRRVKTPFRVDRLIKISDGKPVSASRTTAGGWSYVRDSRAVVEQALPADGGDVVE
jgi:hypothetical protein